MPKKAKKILGVLIIVIFLIAGFIVVTQFMDIDIKWKKTTTSDDNGEEKEERIICDEMTTDDLCIICAKDSRLIHESRSQLSTMQYRCWYIVSDEWKGCSPRHAFDEEKSIFFYASTGFVLQEYYKRIPECEISGDYSVASVLIRDEDMREPDYPLDISDKTKFRFMSETKFFDEFKFSVFVCPENTGTYCVETETKSYGCDSPFIKPMFVNLNRGVKNVYIKPIEGKVSICSLSADGINIWLEEE